jgi:hypothetical protein
MEFRDIFARETLWPQKTKNKTEINDFTGTVIDDPRALRATMMYVVNTCQCFYGFERGWAGDADHGDTRTTPSA